LQKDDTPTTEQQIYVPLSDSRSFLVNRITTEFDDFDYLISLNQSARLCCSCILFSNWLILLCIQLKILLLTQMPKAKDLVLPRKVWQLS